MPVTRSSSLLNIPRPSMHNGRAHNDRATSSPDPEVIVIDSGDEGIPITKRSRPSKTAAGRRSKSRGKALGPSRLPSDVVELSSSDEVNAAESSSRIPKLRRRVKNLQDENLRLKRDKTCLNHNLTELRSEYKNLLHEADVLRTAIRKGPEQGKIVLDADHVEENITCEICTLKMWEPYTLPQCGHSFCQSCLEDWFSNTTTQYMANHPNYIPPVLPSGFDRVIRNWQEFPLDMRLQVAASLVRLKAVRPKYTCPSCREEVCQKPIENFALKSIVHMVAKAQGEADPRMEQLRTAGRRKDMWDGFFLPGII